MRVFQAWKLFSNTWKYFAQQSKFCAAEKVDAVCNRLVTPVRKYFFRLAQKSGMSASSTGTAIELLYLHPHNTTVADELYETGR
jgi:hypothetical protein